MKKNLLGLFVLVLVAVPAVSQEGDTKGAMEATSKLLGETFAKSSTLQRESVLFNDPDCPAQILRVSFEFEDEDTEITASNHLSFVQPASAVEVRHILFDVFGRHMTNISNVEVNDFSATPNLFSSRWEDLDEKDATRLLTTVTYVARVRLADGTQWVFDPDSLATELGKLQLEKKIGEEAE